MTGPQPSNPVDAVGTLFHGDRWPTVKEARRAHDDRKARHDAQREAVTSIAAMILVIGVTAGLLVLLALACLATWQTVVG